MVTAQEPIATDVTSFSIAGDWLYFRTADALYGVCK